MSSRTEKAKGVRKYFVEMEKLVKTYYDIIKHEMYEKIGVLEENQKPKQNIEGGVIFVLDAQNSGVTLYKLGKTSNLKNRMKTYNPGNANDVEPTFIMRTPNINTVETCIKSACEIYQHRKYKEIYEIDIDVLRKIMEKCNDVNIFAINNKSKNIKKETTVVIDRMKTKQSKYFALIDKNNS